VLEFLNPANAWDTIQGFLEAGGPVVFVLLCSTALMWILISERFLYFGFASPRLRDRQVARWNDIDDHSGWESHMFRERLISEVKIESERYMGIIRALIMVTPLLGLLGTVTGMIEVFQVITDTGSSNARLMASGISKATIPTMTGLAVSLTGVFSMSFLDRRNEVAVADVSSRLELDAGATGFGSGQRLLSGEADEAEVNITPLLDIVFILLIFFIVTSTFLDEEGLEIVTPSENEQQEQTRPPPTLVLSVRTDGFVMVDDVRMIDPRSVKPVVEAFKAEEPRGVVLLNAAPDAEINATVLTLDQARQAGVDPALAIQE